MYYFILLALFLLLANAQDVKIEAKFDANGNQTERKVFAFEGEVVKFNSTLSISIKNGSLRGEKIFLHCRMTYLPVVNLFNWTDIDLSTVSTDTAEIEFDVIAEVKRLGGSYLMCSVVQLSNSTILYEEKVAQLIIKRKQTIAELIFRIIVTIFVVFLTFVMGCGLDVNIVLKYFKKPVSPFIGFCSQFILMPLISAGLAKFTKIDNAFGLGLLVIGCSPGGGASNIWTILFGGDLNLSMTMTFISSCAALGVMPLWLFALGRLFVDPKIVVIPYGNIALNLLQMVVPAALGILFRCKWEKKATSLMNKVKFLGLIFVIFIFTYGMYANVYIFKILGDYLYLLPIGAFLPWLGFMFGLLLALVTRRKKEQAIAIALETGFQNIGIAVLILKFSMPQPDGDLGSVMPIVVALFTPLPLYVGYAALIIKRKCCPSKKKDSEKTNIPINDAESMLLKEPLKELLEEKT